MCRLWKRGLLALCCLMAAMVGVHSQDVTCNDPGDIVFVLDGSESLADTEFKNMKKFVVNVLQMFDLDSGTIHVGAHTFGREVYDSMPLNSISDPFFLKFRIQALKRSPAVTGTNTHLAIRRMRTDFTENGRAGVKHIAVLITDGLSGLPSLTAHQARLAKEDDIRMIVVGFGDRVFEPELTAIASSNSSIFQSNQFSDLIALVQTAIKEAICIAKSSSAAKHGTDKTVSNQVIAATTTPALTDVNETKVVQASTSIGNLVVSQQTGVTSYTSISDNTNTQTFFYMFLLLIPILVQYMYQ